MSTRAKRKGGQEQNAGAAAPPPAAAEVDAASAAKTARATKARKAIAAEQAAEAEAAAPSPAPGVKKAGRGKAKKEAGSAVSETGAAAPDAAPDKEDAAPKGRGKKNKAESVAAAAAVVAGSAVAADEAPAKKAKLAKMASVGVSRGATPRAAALASAFTILSWNVNGLRAVLKASQSAFQQLIKKYSPDIVCLQETKLQEGQGDSLAHVLPGYQAHWTYSTVKKGYSGCVAFIRDGVKASVTFDTHPSEHKGEGRAITVELPKFYLVALYVPNSGMALERLDYRVNSWDPHLVQYLKGLEKKKPLVMTGDLNVAHLDQDIYNFDAKHIVKTAGCTPQERASFGKMLEQGFVDTFRRLHPDVTGVYTYWSMRTGARAVNKGLRLDYFVASQSMYAPDSKVKVHDSLVLDEEGQGMSDHCPILLSLDLID